MHIRAVWPLLPLVGALIVAVSCGGAGGQVGRLSITVTRAPQGTDRFDIECRPPTETVSGASVPSDVNEPVDTPPPDSGRSPWVCRMLRSNPVMLDPPPIASTCAGSYGIPPEITVRGTYQGRRIDFSVRPCDTPGGRRRSAILWLRALGLTGLLDRPEALPASAGGRAQLREAGGHTP